jgi:hypothetical protein
MPEREAPSIRRLNIFAAAGWLGALGLAAAGCGADADAAPDASGQGADDVLDGAPIGRVCKPEASNQYYITAQRELDALAGCVDIDASLFIDSAPGEALDLRPLASVRRVSGQFSIGCNPYASLESYCLEPFARPIPLEGVEAIESVGGLTLGGLLVPSLAPFRALRRIGTSLSIVNCSELTTLDGLENAPGVASVDLTANAQLTSLAGLNIAARMERLHLQGSPALEDLSSLASLESVDLVDLGALPLRDLRAFSGIASLGELHLSGLRELTDLTGLGGLRSMVRLNVVGTGLQSFEGLELNSLETLDIWSGTRLRQVDALSRLTSLDQMNVVENSALERLPEFPNLEALGGVFLDSNDRLVQGPSFPRLTRVGYGYITISRNPGLERLAGFSAMQEAAAIDIRQNDRLVELDFGSLTFAGSLVVTCNRELPDATLAPLEQVDTAGDRLLVGNQSSPEACNPI